MWVSTFHSACVRILRADGEALGYPRRFSIYDSADSNRLVSATSSATWVSTRSDSPLGECRESSRSTKNELVTRRRDGRPSREYLRPQARRDLRRVPGASAAGRSDGLRRSADQRRRRCFAKHGDVLEHYRERFSHILVDEYQDTNQAQNEMVLMLAGGHRAVTVVGDSDQGVYGWRGRRPPQHFGLRRGLPRRHDGGARPELSQHADDPRRSERGHRQQH